MIARPALLAGMLALLAGCATSTPVADVKALRPCSWKPDLVEVLSSGALAQSIGPVMEPGGAVVARFYSVRRLDGPGVWRIVFDNGYDVCNCAGTPAK